MLKLPAIKCTQTTKADVYQTASTVHEIVPYLLNGHDPRSQNWKNLPAQVREMYEKLQRKTSKSRRTEMRNYILRRMSPDSYWIGAIPPLVVGMQLGQEFETVSDDKYLGHVRVSTRLDRPNILLDGLGRITGFLDVMYDETLSKETRDWAGRAVIPIMLVTPVTADGELNLSELGQIFHDMNVLSTPVGKGQAVDLDRSDLYIQTTTELAKIDVIRTHGGCDSRAVSISKKSSSWTTKTVLLKAVRAAAEGPGSHVDHIRDNLPDPFLKGKKEMSQVVERFDEALVAITHRTDVSKPYSLARTSTWWVALGLVLHDLHRTYDGASFSDERRATLLQRLAAIDWSLGNPELSFLGQPVEEKDGSKPVDNHGRLVINRFFGGSKAYYNLATFIRQKIGLRDFVSYGEDYGTSIRFGDEAAVGADDKVAVPAE